MTSPDRYSPDNTQQQVRSALYHRLHWLWPVLARPGIGRFLRLLGWAAFVGWLLFVVLILALRFAVLPKVADYKGEIEAAASKAIGQQLRIERIEARWRGLNPDLVLDGVSVADKQGLPAFALTRVEAVLSWDTLWRLRPTLGLLAIDGPVLQVRRDANGKISIAGMETEGESDPALAEWVLEQKKIRIRDATIVWDDRQRNAAPLVLEDLQFGLDNWGSRHRFGLSAAPPAELAARVDLRGEVRGDIGQALESLSGKVFVQLDYADLAGWRAWVDYPVHLPQGRGAVRVWGDLDGGEGKVTADVALEELSISFGRKLPLLDLASLRGRVEGRYKANEWAVLGKQVELQTRDGLRVAPSDFQLEWRENPKTAAVHGNARANFVDLGALAKLAAYLPLDDNSRSLLDKYRPRGRISGLRASWAQEGEVLSRYSLVAGFSELGIEADGYFPGAGGLSGYIDVSEKAGDLMLDSDESHLSLPAVFPEPDIDFERLKAKVSWKNDKGATDVKLERLDFSGKDAAGSARGNYRYTGDGPGEIDLLANIDRADGVAVWRYMPRVVNADARNWLKRGIVAGKASEGRLVLKGNLKDFPFRNPATGKFLVTAKASGTKIDYAAGWPVIDGIEADMSFGVGMKIVARKGAVFGANLSGVTVEIPDFESHEELLQVRGLAQGPTAEFLRFVSQSPVAEAIDRFTDDMKASGNGRLDLELDIPLRHAPDTKVRGTYHFQNNMLQPLAGLPPITQVNGRLAITEKSVETPDLTGRTFGGPVKVVIRSAGDKVAVQASGTAQMSEVSKHFAWPLINHLAGSSPWKADVAVHKHNAEVVVESNLLGVSSPLPEPLNKNAMTPLPLRIERSQPDAQREQYRITLGKVAQGLVVRRGDVWERGVFAVGDAEPRLPDKGLAVRVSVPHIDADAWRNFLPEGSNGGESAGSGLDLNLVSLRTPQLHLLDRDYSQVEVGLRPRDGGWQIALNTKEAAGDIFWRGAGDGWVEGNLKRLHVRSASESAGSGGSSSLLNSLPGMNLTVDDLHVGDKVLGKLELKARNDKGAWQLDRLNLSNPDGALTGKGTWVNTGRHRTRLDFELKAHDIGKLLDRLGYVNAVRRGSATLKGDMQWFGPLTGIDYPSLSGQMSVEAAKGQFNKLEPGVGKLLGLISLQSLPRRLTLDFRDIFSDGLAFDSIEGKLVVRSGIMRTVEPLRIYGPAAQIEIQGETNLERETQDLNVVVRPELGGLAAVGVGAVMLNPVAGAAALVANTVLQKPLNRLFSYRYHVTGGWSDPQIDKAGKEEKLVPADNAAPASPTEGDKE